MPISEKDNFKYLIFLKNEIYFLLQSAYVADTYRIKFLPSCNCTQQQRKGCHPWSPNIKCFILDDCRHCFSQKLPCFLSATEKCTLFHFVSFSPGRNWLVIWWKKIKNFYQLINKWFYLLSVGEIKLKIL